LLLLPLSIMVNKGNPRKVLVGKKICKYYSFSKKNPFTHCNPFRLN
jgi:hypothetical protein